MNFYSEISEGGQIDYLSNHHGIKGLLNDGTVTTFRPYSSTEGSPAVEIKINNENHAHKILFKQR